jgi:hypothetical protein
MSLASRASVIVASLFAIPAVFGGCSALLGLEDGTLITDTDGSADTSASPQDAGAEDSVANSDRPPDLDAPLKADSSDSADGHAWDGGDGDGPTFPPKLECAQYQVTTSGKTLVTVDTANGTDRFHPTCGQGTASDVAIDWIAPTSDYYSINTLGSDFDTVLGLFDPSCSDAGSSEIDCSNNTASGSQSEIVRHFNKGDRVLVVIDGYAGAHGTAVFNAEPITCPKQDITGQSLPATFTTAGGASDHSGTCGGQNQPEQSFHWTAPSSALYRFTAKSDAMQPSLYLEDGMTCGSTLLQCSRGEKGGYPAEVTRWLNAGDSVTIIVDSGTGSGEFILDVQPVSAPTCPQQQVPTVDAGSEQVIDANSTTHALSPSCAQAGSLLSMYTGGAYPVDTFAYTLSLGPSTSCDLIITADYTFVAFLIQGAQCDGPERACVVSQHADAGPLYEATIKLNFTMNGDYVLAVQSSMPWQKLTYRFTTRCIA